VQQWQVFVAARAASSLTRRRPPPPLLRLSESHTASPHVVVVVDVGVNDDVLVIVC